MLTTVPYFLREGIKNTLLFMDIPINGGGELKSPPPGHLCDFVLSVSLCIESSDMHVGKRYKNTYFIRKCP